MIDDSYGAVKDDFITALRIIYREGLSDAFAHLSMRSNEGNEMMFMPRKSPALVKSDELFFVDFDKPVPQSSLHQAIYKALFTSGSRCARFACWRFFWRSRRGCKPKP